MARSTTKKAKKAKPAAAAAATADYDKSPFLIRTKDEKPSREAQAQVHLLGPGKVCDTESRGHANPEGRSITEIVVDASEGFVPLWAKGQTLRWRFNDRSMARFANPTAARNAIRRLLGEALTAWGDAAPVKFTENRDVWDFEIVMKAADNCNGSGCVLASAFFPDGGRHALTIYPKMFTQTRTEQVETLIHEIGHVFGLRHFFALVSETAWPAHVFGTHSKFSIMNYGQLSALTETDKRDLKLLYQKVWSGAITQINGTPVRLVKPFHTLSFGADNAIAIEPVPVGAQGTPGNNYDGV
ncbi:matrixin family metalloprotease [Paraflavitalea sp. CAU 1676]|uniref:matrixin family metalloprotease n=1 Tax=Paraflavitalea sp. CAU 1676 TaxID=3032598 RepID=UPI0023DA66FD|nr:matrixin family metalloprotease [Paraflavitalea sp. CAU 1676]MDF2188550.1 matrixin family metalloprotease [Paraflavitalea sp. CAU 1676]